MILHAALGRLLQRVEEARAVRAGVLAEEEHRVALGRNRRTRTVPTGDADRPSSAPPRSSRGTCSSCRAGCCCRRAARTARRGRRFRGWRGRTRRRRPTSGRAPSAPRRSPRRPRPTRTAHIGRWPDRSAADGSAGPAARGRSPSSSRSSVTVCLAKKSGVQRRVVSSHSVALAPFSQNSNG